jgi:putative phosphoesterase
MRILVISDTHIPVSAHKLPSIIEEEARKSDCCLHAGDFITIETFELLNSWTKAYGVHGNMDDSSIIEELPLKQILKFEEITIGLIHGRGTPGNLINYINCEFYQELADIDVFVFGHSHQSMNKDIDGKIYFNPGSPTDQIFTPYRSYGILEINGKDIKSEVIQIE